MEIKKQVQFVSFLFIVAAILTCTSMRLQQEPPQADISNGLVTVNLYLPDAENGYYRGTRFDWSGVMPVVRYNGHDYHGKWFKNYSPTMHDAIMGPVEEFGALGYEDAKAGGTFLKIGVGSLVKSDDRQYSPFRFYQIANSGKWKMTRKSNEIMFVHTLADSNYAYEYKKTVLLPKGKAEMVLLHTLTNKSKRTIETTVYNHNFFVFDEQPTAPGYVVSFPINNLSGIDGKGEGDIVKLQGNQLVYNRSLSQGEQAYFPNLNAGVPMPYDIKVEHTQTGAGVRIKGDRDVAKMVYWSSSTTVSPEPYINIRVEPGKSFTWKITYEYYTLPGKP